MKIVEHFKPKAFVFENVPGILSAKPDGTSIVDRIKTAFDKAGYIIIPNLRNAVIDFSEYGVPQKRKRVIILGLNKKVYGKKAEGILEKFYNEVLPSYKEERKTLSDAIADLLKLIPLEKPIRVNGRKTAHSVSDSKTFNHVARYQNERDIDLFKLLAEDIEQGENKFASVESRKDLYTQHTGKTSNIHKYHVLKWDEPSTTIPAHLCKDGLRHIHPDSRQARTITVRETARIQTFPDDYEFIGAMTNQFKMIGNAVPPEFARKLALAIAELLF